MEIIFEKSSIACIVLRIALLVVLALILIKHYVDEHGFELMSFTFVSIRCMNLSFYVFVY